MEYKPKHLPAQYVALSGSKVRLLLNGTIGGDLDGNYFAQELAYLSSINEIKEVNISINCAGGSIFQGWSIINGMNALRMQGKTVSTAVVGIADSMAGVILAFGDRGHRSATSFSTGVIHEPLYTDKEGKLIALDQLPEGSIKTEAQNMRASLVDSLIHSTGKTKKEIKAVMKLNKRHTAPELKALGFIDQVIVGKNTPADLPEDLQNATASQLMVACSSAAVENLNKTNPLQMKNLLALFTAFAGIAIVTEEQAMEQFKNLKTLADSAGDLQAKLTAQSELATGYKNQITEINNQAAVDFVEQRITAGLFKAEQKEALVAQAKDNLEGFKALCGSLSTQFVDVTKGLPGHGQGTGGGATKEQELELAKAYHQADMTDGGLNDYKNEVGTETFKKAEDAYIKHMPAVAEA